MLSTIFFLNMDRIRNMENEITYRDKQILEVQEQLKSIKNVKKLQDRSILYSFISLEIVSDLQNEDVIERIQQY